MTAAIEDQVADPVWSVDGSALYFRAIDNATYDETVYRYTPADQRTEAIVHGEETYGRFAAAGTDGVVSAIEDATHAPDLWFVGAGERTRITDLNPQQRFAFSKPKLLLLQRRRQLLHLETGRHGRSEGAGHHLGLKDDAGNP